LPPRLIAVKCSDVPDDHVIELAQRWREGRGPGVVAALEAEGVPYKVALAKVERLARRKKLDYGVSPHYAWPS
jgi:hypothetical protein